MKSWFLHMKKTKEQISYCSGISASLLLLPMAHCQYIHVTLEVPFLGGLREIVLLMELVGIVYNCVVSAFCFVNQNWY